jgi:hypothetical protein
MNKDRKGKLSRFGDRGTAIGGVGASGMSIFAERKRTTQQTLPISADRSRDGRF